MLYIHLISLYMQRAAEQNIIRPDVLFCLTMLICCNVLRRESRRARTLHIARDRVQIFMNSDFKISNIDLRLLSLILYLVCVYTLEYPRDAERADVFKYSQYCMDYISANLYKKRIEPDRNCTVYVG